MACLSLGYLQSFLIWLVIIIGAIAVLRLFVPWIGAQVGGPDSGLILSILRIIIWVVVMIAVIYVVFNLISCLTGGVSILPVRR